MGTSKSDKAVEEEIFALLRKNPEASMRVHAWVHGVGHHVERQRLCAWANLWLREAWGCGPKQGCMHVCIMCVIVEAVLVLACAYICPRGQLLLPHSWQ